MKNRVLLIYTLITLMFFGILIKLEYATDTYSVFNFNSEENFAQYAMSGRFITAIIGSFLKLINISEYGMYFMSWILAIVCAITSEYKLYTIIEKDVESKVIKLMLPILIIINPFSIELFLYIEKGIMWFGILMCILALENLVNFFEDKYELDTNKKKQKLKLVLALIFMFLANCAYQGIIGIFISISLVFILKYSKNIKEFILNNVITGLIYGIPTIINFLLVKVIYKQGRMSGEIIFFKSLEKIYLNTIDMIKYMYNILPKYLFIFLILFTFSVFCCKIFKQEGRFLELLKFIYILIGVTFAAIVPQFVQPTTSIWLVPRTTYCFASLYGILILYLSMNYELANISKILIFTISALILLLQVQKFIQIEQSRYLLNESDEQITMQIIKEIEEYELKTNQYITEISLYQDARPNYTYRGVFATGDINVKCYANGWSTVSILSYYLKRNIKLVENNEKLTQEFAKKNWEDFDKKQIIFEKNRLILCNY